MKKLSQMLFIAMIGITPSILLGKSIDSIDITCTDTKGVFSRFFKLTPSSDEENKVFWKDHYGAEPRHLGLDQVTKTTIKSCIEIVDYDNQLKAECIELNRETGRFWYIYGEPDDYSEFPNRLFFKEGHSGGYGFCKVNSKKLF